MQNVLFVISKTFITTILLFACKVTHWATLFVKTLPKLLVRVHTKLLTKLHVRLLLKLLKSYLKETNTIKTSFIWKKTSNDTQMHLHAKSSELYFTPKNRLVSKLLTTPKTGQTDPRPLAVFIFKTTSRSFVLSLHTKLFVLQNKKINNMYT